MIVETMTQLDIANYIRVHKILKKLNAIASNDPKFARRLDRLKTNECVIKSIKYDRNEYFYVIKYHGSGGRSYGIYAFLKLFNKNHYEYYKIDPSITLPNQKRCVWKISNHFIQRYTDRWEGKEDLTNETDEQFIKRLVMDFNDVGVFPDEFESNEEITEIKDTDSFFISTRTGIIRCIVNDNTGSYVYATYYRENKSDLFKEIRDYMTECANYQDGCKDFVIDLGKTTNIFVERKETEDKPRTIYVFDCYGHYLTRTETGWKEEKEEETRGDTINLLDCIHEMNEEPI